MKVFDQSLFVHPQDRTLMTKIIGSPAVRRVMNKAFAEGLDQMSGFLYGLSGVQLPPEHPACQALKEACVCFGVPAVPPVYTVRSDDPAVQLGGCSHPVVLTPHRLLASGCEDMLRGRMAAAAAAIAAGHHRIAFLMRLLESFSGVPGFPGIDAAVRDALLEWMRFRQYTTDRAFCLFTGSIELARKNVLFGQTPHDMPENSAFGGCAETCRTQIHDCDRTAFAQSEAWLPLRCQELEKFHEETGGRT